MKITLVTKENTWHDEKIEEEAKITGVDFEVRDFKDLNDLREIDELGDIVVWRSSSLGRGSARDVVFRLIDKTGRRIINRSLLTNPSVGHKLYQQKIVEGLSPDVNTIQTFSFSNKEDLIEGIKEGQLKIPFIKKPNLGFQGRGVELVSSSNEIDTFKEGSFEEVIFQNYIENDGDYRVLIVGGRSLGVIKRVAAEGSFLNNVSRGGKALIVKDRNLEIRLSGIASQIVTFFDLSLCGVDLMVDKKTGEIYFLELNTVPQWEGFQEATGVNVAGEIIKYCQGLSSSEVRESLVSKVKDNYQTAKFLDDRNRFHFYSRLYLWERREEYFCQLLKLRGYFFGDSGEEGAWLREILEDKDFYSKKIFNSKPFREKAVKKYPFLGSYHEILFRALIARTVFGEDVTREIDRIVGREPLVALRNVLLKDEESILKLSTFAINYFYLVSNYFKDDKFKLNLIQKITRIIEKKLDFAGGGIEGMRNAFYFLTHCIIGESDFYSKKIIFERGFYLKIIRNLEKIIRENYFEISLDNKLEFIVCARLLDYESALESIIQEEARKSISGVGVFIVDKFNSSALTPCKKSFPESEHRNVLYLMANLKKNG